VNDSERDVTLHSAALVVVEMVPSFLYPLSLTIGDYLSLSQRSEAKRSAAQRSRSGNRPLDRVTLCKIKHLLFFFLFFHFFVYHLW